MIRSLTDVSRAWKTMVAALTLLSFSSAMWASEITATATGVVDNVPEDLSEFFSPGDTFTMTYTFESTTSPREDSTSQSAVFDALTSISFTLGSYSGSALGGEEIQIDNDPEAPDDDRYSVGPGAGSTVLGDPIGGFSLASFFIRLDDNTNQVFSDALVLPTNLSLGDFTSAGFSVIFSPQILVLAQEGAVPAGSLADAFIDGHLTNVVFTPEPGGLALAIAALVTMAVAWRRRRSRV